MYRTKLVLIGATTVLACALLASAHPNHASGTSGLAAGAAHPFAGADHLLAMLAVGLLAARLGGRVLWLLPLLFVVGMAVGGAAAVAAGTGSVGGVEQLIAASVVVFGLLLVAAGRLPTTFATTTVPAFAFFHGYAHLVEGVARDGHRAAAYGAGVLAATALLHGIGIAVGSLAMARRVRVDAIWRLTGTAVAGVGVALFVQAT